MGQERNIVLYGTGILFEEPNPTGSRPRDLIGLCKRTETPEEARRTKAESDAQRIKPKGPIPERCLGHPWGARGKKLADSSQEKGGFFRPNRQCRPLERQ